MGELNSTLTLWNHGVVNNPHHPGPLPLHKDQNFSLQEEQKMTLRIKPTLQLKHWIFFCSLTLKKKAM